MKRLLFVIMLLAACSAIAADVSLTWDQVPGQVWEKVRIYEKIGTTYVMKAEVSGTTTTATLANVPVGTHIYIARSFAAATESDDSNTAPATIKPAAVPNFRIAVTVAEDGTLTFKLLADGR